MTILVCYLQSLKKFSSTMSVLNDLQFLSALYRTPVYVLKSHSRLSHQVRNTKPQLILLSDLVYNTALIMFLGDSPGIIKCKRTRSASSCTESDFSCFFMAFTTSDTATVITSR